VKYVLDEALETANPDGNIRKPRSTHSKTDPCNSLEGTRSAISIGDARHRCNDKIVDITRAPKQYDVFKSVRQDQRQVKESYFKTSECAIFQRR
jgi:hypothetical protein